MTSSFHLSPSFFDNEGRDIQWRIALSLLKSLILDNLLTRCKVLYSVQLRNYGPYWWTIVPTCYNYSNYRKSYCSWFLRLLRCERELVTVMSDPSNVGEYPRDWTPSQTPCHRKISIFHFYTPGKHPLVHSKNLALEGNARHWLVIIVIHLSYANIWR